MVMKYDFSGWATRNNLKCSDGVTIRKDAFVDQDGQVVPLVWNHQHNDPNNVLGHALLENREDGVYAYCTFNENETSALAKELVRHGDVCALSIFANKLKKNGENVLHGVIREVSLVLAGANPGAYIENVLEHSANTDEEFVYYAYLEDSISLEHSDAEKETNNVENENEKEKEMDNKKKTVQDVFDELTDEQKTVVFALIGQAVEDAKKENNEEDTPVKHNVFDKETENNSVLCHSEQMAIIDEARKNNAPSMRDVFIAHADGDDDEQAYGITNVDYLFPDARNVNNTPDFISRDMTWVDEVMNGAKHVPFSRIKSTHANITADEARAKGYVKGNRKAEEVIVLLKRTTGPCTIYKKQKLDRDDIVDIIDFDVVAWLKSEMRMMLNEEIARAALVGDNRSAADDDYINPVNIRPIYSDDELYTIRKSITIAANGTSDDLAKATIRGAIKARKDYKGSGNPVFFTTEDMLTDMLLLEDSVGRPLYDSVQTLATKLRVRKIVTVPVMENMVREGSGADAGKNFNLLGIIVNMQDYAFGADKGGNVALFDDFDINFNQQIYLMETRCSGALTKPYSAIVLEQEVAAD